MHTSHIFEDRSRSGGPLRFLNHNGLPLATKGITQLQKVLDYLESHAPFYKLSPADLIALPRQLDSKPSKEKASYRLDTIKDVMDSATYVFVQTYYGLPVWEAGLSVSLHKTSHRILNSSSAAYEELAVATDFKSVESLKPLDPGAFMEALGLNNVGKGKKDDGQRHVPQITGERLLVYRYDASKRTISPIPSSNPKPDAKAEKADPFVLPLPPVPTSLKDGAFYVAREVLFSLSVAGLPKVNWRAFVDIESGAVLFLRAFASAATGLVFEVDPATQGSSTALRTSNSATLDPFRDNVILLNLNPPNAAGVQALSGSLVAVQNVEVPNIAAPTTMSPYSFAYEVRTNDFAATNSYFHCNGFLQLVLDLGFSTSYYGATVFPVPVDHRGFGDPVSDPQGLDINAHCLGGASGITSVDFALEDLGDTGNPMGIAADRRVVLHEIGGHGVLYCHVSGANFGFSHSAGDSVAAILCDPGSLASDRFLTFPWVADIIDRRHDRTPAGGWGWAGNIALHPFDWSLDYGGYNNEQILSTTLFRLYRAVGGDSTDINRQRFASRLSVYLILRAIGSLTPATNPATAMGFEQALESADAGDWVSTNPAETNAGGAYMKVIRWAFEKQGLFQLPGTATPNNSPGNPPAVDVYIDDSRHGEYDFLANHWSTQDIWNRTSPGDGGGVHQEPILDQPNYAYVRIKNRGYQTATGVLVKAFHCLPGVGLTYPDDWMAMSPSQLPAPDLAANDSVGVIVGPFEWMPSQEGHECMFMSVSAAGDPSNIDGRVTGPISEWRLVPNDNNIAQRNVAPVPGGGLQRDLVEAFRNRPFWIRNTFDRRVKVEISVNLPEALTRRGWELRFVNEGGKSFFLQEGERKQARLQLHAGAPLDSLKPLAHQQIEVVVKEDGIVVGGMNYVIDPNVRHATKGGPKHEQEEGGRLHEARELLGELLHDRLHIRSVSMKKAIIEIDFDEKDRD